MGRASKDPTLTCVVVGDVFVCADGSCVPLPPDDRSAAPAAPRVGVVRRIAQWRFGIGLTRPGQTGRA